MRVTTDDGSSTGFNPCAESPMDTVFLLASVMSLVGAVALMRVKSAVRS